MKDFLLVAMAKIEADTFQDAYNELYRVLCITGDIGFSINEYAITAEGGLDFVREPEEDEE